MHQPLHTISAHYQAIIDKDMANILNKYVQSEETYVVLEGPRLTTIGYTKIANGWADFCNSSLSLLSIDWTEGPFAEAGADMAWVSGIIKLKVQVKENSFENIFRASFVLLLQNGEWKIKHEHVSVVHPDPYGIGDWLQKK
jgi:ketosteroid isomerase-like protein